MEMADILANLGNFLQVLYLHPFLVTLFLLSIFFSFIHNIRSNGHKSNFPPSPPRLPIIGNLHQLGTNPHRSLRELSEKYGPLMLLHLGHVPTLVLSSAEVMKEIKTHDVAFSGRPKITAAHMFFYGCKDVAFAPYGDSWKRARKITVHELLSAKRVQSFRFVREEEVTTLVDEINKACLGGVSVNLSEMMIATVNNIVFRCIVGETFTKGNDPGRFEEVTRRAMVEIMAVCVGDFFPSLKWIDVLRGFIRRLKETSRELDSFVLRVIEDHEASQSDNNRGSNEDLKDFVDILLQLRMNNMLDFQLTEDDVKAIILDMLIAGIDTTSLSLEWLMAELVRSPRAMKKAQEEVRRVVGKKPKIDIDDINKMDYLKCVIKETLRLHPPGALIPRATTTTVEIGGCNFPAETRVLINSWAIQRDRSVWERPDEFLPERFENSCVDFKGQDFELIPFGFGRRGCPGLAFGVLTMEFVTANLLYWFDWKLCGDTTLPEELDMSEVYGLAVLKKIPLHLKPVMYYP